MKVKKIKIEQELLDIPDGMPIYRENVLPELSEVLSDNQEIPDTMITGEQITYRVRELYSGINNLKERYLVKVNEDDIFDDLLKIGDHDINKAITKKFDEGFERVRMETKINKANTKKRLENNPLWRRILKKYE